MKIYVLIYKEDTDSCYETQVELYSAGALAAEAMKAAYEDKLREIHFDTSWQTDDDHSCSITETAACITDGEDYYGWSIETHELKDLLVK